MKENSSFTARLAGRAYDLIFGQIHSRRLVFNACWEDPRIDRQLLRLDKQSRVLAISSAGCNVLDYLLDDPARLHAVDLNPRQNAVLWLKMKLIERGNYNDLFAVFGRGSHPGFKEVFGAFEGELPDYAREFWSAKMHYVDGTHRRGTFYYHGASGDAAWLFARVFLRAQRRLRQTVEDLLNATSLDEQQAVYDRLEPRLWNRVSRWLVGQPFFLSLLGTPRPQARLIERSHSKGVGSRFDPPGADYGNTFSFLGPKWTGNPLRPLIVRIFAGAPPEPPRFLLSRGFSNGPHGRKFAAG